jgi:hypothetical protein
MKIFTTIIVAGLLMSGCQGAIQRQQAQWNGYTKVCVEGVTYIQFPTGTVVQRDRADHIVPCD